MTDNAKIKMDAVSKSTTIEIVKVITDSFGYPDYYLLSIKEIVKDYHSNRINSIDIGLNQSQLDELSEMIKKVQIDIFEEDEND